MPALIFDDPDGRTVQGGSGVQSQQNVSVLYGSGSQSQSDVSIARGVASQSQSNVTPSLGSGTQSQSNVTGVASGVSLSSQSNVQPPPASGIASQSQSNVFITIGTGFSFVTDLTTFPATVNAVTAHLYFNAGSAIATHPNHMRCVHEWRGSWYIGLRSTEGRILIYRYLDDGTADPDNPLPDANGIGNLVADDASWGFFQHTENVHSLEAVFSVNGVLRKWRSHDDGATWAELIP